MNKDSVSVKRLSDKKIILNYTIPVTSFGDKIENYNFTLKLVKQEKSKLSNSNLRKKSNFNQYLIIDQTKILKKISNTLSVKTKNINLVSSFVDFDYNLEGEFIHIPFITTEIMVTDLNYRRNKKIESILDFA